MAVVQSAMSRATEDHSALEKRQSYSDEKTPLSLMDDGQMSESTAMGSMRTGLNSANNNSNMTSNATDFQSGLHQETLRKI